MIFLNSKRKVLCIELIFLLIMNIAILFNIFILRQVFGFIFLTLFPGWIILNILQLKSLTIEKQFFLSVGLSISFVILIGLLLNSICPLFGHNAPLSLNTVLLSMNVILLILIIIKYRLFESNSKIIPIITLSRYDKIFLIIPIIFYILAIWGIQYMNVEKDNFILIILYLLIPIYLFVFFLFNKQVSEKLYPVIIYLISLALILLFSLRGSHIIGSDTHEEFYLFSNTLHNLRWIIENEVISSSLVISILPTIYQVFSKIQPEILFRLIYPILYSISPIGVYIIGKKFLTNQYAFLAACFFMFNVVFLKAAYFARTVCAIFFFIMLLIILLDVDINLSKKSPLIIICIFLIILSHYSSAYIFGVILLILFISNKIIFKRFPDNYYTISSFFLLSFILLIIFWNGFVVSSNMQATLIFSKKASTSILVPPVSIQPTPIQPTPIQPTPIQPTPIQPIPTPPPLGPLEPMQTSNLPALLGVDIVTKGLPQQLEFIFTWINLCLIGLGVLIIFFYYLVRYYRIDIYNNPVLKDFNLNLLNEIKFWDIDKSFFFFLISIGCCIILLANIYIPYIAIGYGIERSFAFVSPILSIFFIIGGIFLGTICNYCYLKIRRNTHKEIINQNNLKFFILIIIIIYYFSITGITYQLSGVPRSIIINDHGESFDKLYVFDQDVAAAKWLSTTGKIKEVPIYSDTTGVAILLSQGMIRQGIYPYWIFERTYDSSYKMEGYFFLRTTNINERKLSITMGWVDINKYSNDFYNKMLIYNAGKSRILK